MVVILITVLAQNNMSRKCFITFLTTTAQTERSDSNPRLQPRCLRSSHTSLLRRKVAKLGSCLTWFSNASGVPNSRQSEIERECMTFQLWISYVTYWKFRQMEARVFRTASLPVYSIVNSPLESGRYNLQV